MLILNVDDDGDDREFFADAIKVVDPSNTCVVFENGDSLLNFLGTTATPPDYIFIDINMPKMNGYECAREIKSGFLTDDIQIVMYSTAFNPSDLLKFNEEGFKHIVKQNSLADLVRSIKKVIDLPVSLPAGKR